MRVECADRRSLRIRTTPPGDVPVCIEWTLEVPLPLGYLGESSVLRGQL